MGVSASPHDLMSRLVAVLKEPSDFFWNLSLIGEDQVAMLAQLAGDLTAPKSSTGDGKFFDSGFAYWGIEPTVAWIQACTDPMYPVMRNSIESFLPRWERIERAISESSPALSSSERVELRVFGRSAALEVLRLSGG